MCPLVHAIHYTLSLFACAGCQTRGVPSPSEVTGREHTPRNKLHLFPGTHSLPTLIQQQPASMSIKQSHASSVRAAQCGEDIFTEIILLHIVIIY